MYVIECRFYTDLADSAGLAEDGSDNKFYFTDAGDVSGNSNIAGGSNIAGNLEGSGDDFSDQFADAMMIADRATARRILNQLRADKYYDGSRLSIRELVIEE